jgi:hypothetical protein
VNFLFPSSVKHLPNEEQINLLFSLTCKKQFSGFLHPSALTVTMPVTHEIDDRQHVIGLPIDQETPTKITYRSYSITSPDDLAKSLINSAFLYVPFDQIKTYIMNDYNNIVGFIKYQHFETCWLESSISLGELYTAVKHNIPLVQQYIILGRNEVCGLCSGSFRVDWVDEIKYLKTHDKKRIPKNRYILATHRDIYLLIDNIFLDSYDGDNIISICPRCLGTGVSNILTKKTDNEVNNVWFNLGDYGLLICNTRDEIIQTNPNYYTWDLER